MRSVLLGTAAALFAFAAMSAPSIDITGTDDSIITAKVKSALLHEERPRSTAIKVHTTHGVVQLSGMVDSPESKQRAEVIASTTEGVTDVHNNLKVRGTSDLETSAPAGVLAQVRQALSAHPITQARSIGVNRVNEDTVELVGVVGSANEKVTAAKLAVGVEGVRHVENSLNVARLNGRETD